MDGPRRFVDWCLFRGACTELKGTTGVTRIANLGVCWTFWNFQALLAPAHSYGQRAHRIEGGNASKIIKNLHCASYNNDKFVVIITPKGKEKKNIIKGGSSNFRVPHADE